MLIMGSANEAELIFWNKEDRRWVPVHGDPRRQGCYVLVGPNYIEINKLYLSQDENMFHASANTIIR